MPRTILGEPALSTGEVSAALGFQVSVKFLKSCGLSPINEYLTGSYWRTSDFPLICLAISRHLESLNAGAPRE